MIRQLFLDNATRVAELIGRPIVAERWDDMSALNAMSIGSLTAHLTRACTTVVTYLDEPTDQIPEGAAVVSGGRYFASVMGGAPEDLAVLNASVVERAEGEAADGVDAVRARFNDAIETLRSRFTQLDDDHIVLVFGEMAMRLADYLATRTVELVVHTDDLVVSLATEPPNLDPAFERVAIATMVDTAIELHGSTGVVRGLARSERSPRPVFPVF